MAHGATPGLPGTRKRIVPAKTVATAVMLCAVAFSAFFWAHSALTAQAVTINGMVPPYPAYVSPQSVIAGVETSKDWQRATWQAVAEGGTAAAMHRVGDIRAGQYLRVVIHVRDSAGLPIRGEAVSVWWRSKGMLAVDRLLTNEYGDVWATRRIPTSAEGQTVVVSAWADTPEWANGTYVWFVPR